MRTAVSAVVLAAALGFTALTAAFSAGFDFRAFYCAGAAVRDNANPYHTEPLHTCERTRTDGTYAAFAKKVVLPAPQPGYDMAAFAVLARLPFETALRIWTVLLFACSIAAMLLVRRVCDVPLTTVVAAFWLSMCLPSLYLGEVIPLCIAAIAAAAFFAQRGLWNAAGAAAAATLVEPHIGLPVLGAMLLWAPRARVSAGLSAIAIAALSLVTLGAAANLEYVFNVLPAHALSEIGSDAQLSLTVLVHAAGAPDSAALRAGTFSYAVLAIAGWAAARRLARVFDDEAFIVAVPAAFSVLGGVFIHVTDAAAAIPLVLLLLKHSRAHRFALTAALTALAVPCWLLATPMLLGSTGFALAAVTAVALLWSAAPASGLGAAACGAAVFFGAPLLVHWYTAASAAVTPARVTWVRISSTYAEHSWALSTAAWESTGSAASWLLRIPTWSGLAVAAAVCCALALAVPAMRAAERVPA